MDSCRAPGPSGSLKPSGRASRFSDGGVVAAAVDRRRSERRAHQREARVECASVGIHPTIGLPTPSKGSVTKPHPLPLVRGTLDLLVLRALGSGPMHGYGIATLVHERTD